MTCDPVSDEDSEDLAARAKDRRRVVARSGVLATIWRELGHGQRELISSGIGQADMGQISTRSGDTTVGELRGWLARTNAKKKA